MRIALICTYDRGGGAERISYDLFRSYQARGHDARLFVRTNYTTSAGVSEIDPYKGTAPWAALCAFGEQQLRQRPRFRGQARLIDWLRRSAWPQRWIDGLRGADDFNYPASYQLGDDQWAPDIIHAHNLHGDYFDLRALVPLSRAMPVVWTLHDTWALTGHCGHFADIGCERWRTGCGNCPDLRRPPAIRRDATAENWERKRSIYAASRLAIATPSRWLMEYVGQSILKPWQARVIPNGVDRAIFHPADRAEARAALQLPKDGFICMFIAPSGSSVGNPYKDYDTVGRAVNQVLAERPATELSFVCIGGSQESGQDPRFRFPGYISDQREIARYYQAADVLIHAANIDNFPGVILESLACGTPVIGTAVGGIPEQIVDGVNGYLVPRKDSAAIAQRLIELIDQPTRLAQLRRAVLDETERVLGLEQHADAYLEWFGELRPAHRGRGSWSLSNKSF